ncbi:hypothetical protein J4E85_002504 [Alternaria conjuncta]|uniref:uncharacterized protein n=1 Tax=Alternaria conjuncta TaxID=181017 RepID=UPI00221EF7CE|nr:uncharacterized protein J4E85_002504 [Alternaria conjuncta]KAI4934646.1 hypothetical protein J4E85_002504 [Alternaria conjuncta]
MLLLVLIFALLIVAPALIYYFTTWIFYSDFKDKEASGKLPPSIPYSVPIASHYLGFVLNGQQKYFAKLIAEYEHFAPFLVLDFAVLRDPEHTKKVMQACYRRDIRKKYKDAAVNAQDFLITQRGVTTRKYLEGSSLATMTNLYTDILSRNMNDKMFQVSSWTQIEDVWSFLQQVLTRCSLELLFGSAILKQYPGLIKDYWKFEDAIQDYLSVQSLFRPAPYKEPLERLWQGVEKWLKVNHSGTEFAKTGPDDADLDEYRGSKFIQELDDTIASKQLPFEARIAEMLDVMHHSNMELIPCAIWTTIELLRKPYLAEQISAMVSTSKSAKAAAYDVNGILARPLFQSLQAEVSRLRVARYTIYTITADIALDSEWTLPRNCNGISFSRDLALNTKVWAKARPRTVEKPLEEFWAERFLIPEKDTSKAHGQRKSRSSMNEARFDTQDLELLVPAIGDEMAFDPASHYFRAMQAATMAVLFNEFEIQLCDPDLIDAAMPELRESAFGLVQPKEKIAVRIRKRKASKEQ